MQNQPLTLEPQQYEFRSQYLKIDLSEIKRSVETLIADSGRYFSKPLDDALFEVIGAEGVHRKKGAPSDVLEGFELITTETAQARLYLYVEERTKNLGIRQLSQEYVMFAIDFYRRSVYSSISILGLDKAQQIEQLLTEGIELVNVQLPQQHHYIEPFLHNLLTDHPSSDLNVFLIMRFGNTQPFSDIVDAVRTTCAARGLRVLRADDKEYTDDLWDNVLTYMYGCDSAIAIFDQINYREFNPNVALEVGFLRAQCKRVLLLKDRAIPVMPADIVGKIYRTFDTYDAINTIPPQINKWLEDYGIGSAGASSLPASTEMEFATVKETASNA